ncbi:MAG: hypothetical protein VST70_04345 [Nitrospirota bacterium]|nr:hypothetical protein [Nitrospirota bacterium]
MDQKTAEDREDARHRRLKILILVIKAGFGIMLFYTVWSYMMSSA